MTKIIVNGTFDILHVGHLKMLEFAKSFSEARVHVLIDSDRRVKELKGSDRPINNQHDRATFLSALKSVDSVGIFDSDQELDTMIQEYEPDIMVKGSDYREKPVIGSQHCKEILFYDHTGHSTTGLIQRIANR
jgi:D-beta-D-heptose 7-phosphate kinase/D-beta-D-heptose 1-phosphate adenosyltransferase